MGTHRNLATGLSLAILSLAALSCTSEKIFTVSCSDEPVKVVKEAAAYASAHPGKAVSVVFSKGEHFISDSIAVNGIESPFTLRGRKGAVLTGEKEITGWKPSDLGEGIWEADLKACGIS